MAGGPLMEGECSPGFERLKDAFCRNFKDHAEIGAAIALVVNGKLVVDLWGGHRDANRERPWQADTLVNVWSTTKGVTAACFAIAVDRGLCRYEDEVARYWPEFAQAGKQHVTIGQLLSHQAGLSAFARPYVIEDLYDSEAAASELAAQKPLWEPGSAAGYHAISVGFLATALFRRIEGRSIKDFVEQELTTFDVHIGLPPAAGGRVADLAPSEEMSPQESPSELTAIQAQTLGNPVLDPQVANGDAWRKAEIPSANGHAHARGLARLYGNLIGDLDGSGPLVTAKTLTAATALRAEGEDLVLSLEARWAAGFLRNSLGLYGPGESSFGHSGWGGSFAFADPERGLAFAYVMNAMGSDLVGDPRAVNLIEAIYKSL